MNFINFFSNSIIPIIIFLIIIYGLKEEIKIFDVFVDGAKDGMNIVLALFPTLIGLFVAIGALRSSGLIDGLINILSPIFNFMNIPKEILPLVLLRPISRQCINCDWYRYYDSVWS